MFLLRESRNYNHIINFGRVISIKVLPSGHIGSSMQTYKMIRLVEKIQNSRDLY